MDTLTVKGMKFRAFHGVQDHEKKLGNDFEVDVIFYSDMTKAATTDRLEEAINYTKVYEITREVMTDEPVDLIERLCFNIGNKLEEHFSDFKKIEVLLRKLNPPIDAPIAFTEARMTWPR